MFLIIDEETQELIEENSNHILAKHALAQYETHYGRNAYIREKQAILKEHATGGAESEER